MQLDLCSQHLQELTKGAHPVRRGRQRSASPKVAGSAIRGRSTKAGSTAKAAGSKKSGSTRRGRPPGSKNKPKN